MTTPPEPRSPDSPSRMLDMRSGGWVLLLAGILVVATIAWGVRVITQAVKWRDGKAPDAAMSNGFDLADVRVPVNRVTCMFGRDGLPALVRPEQLTPTEVDLMNKGHSKFLVPSDRVIGVVIGGAARAYPIRILNYHEVADDELGGVPIAVTYSALCDSVVVYDRRVAGRVIEFGVSGLLYESNTLLYDRQPEENGKKSLWVQLRGTAIAGPAAAAGWKLKPIPHCLLPWSEWRKLHPETTVIDGIRKYYEKYRSNSYGPYYLGGHPKVPVDLPPKDSHPLMARVLAVRSGGPWRLYFLPAIYDENAWKTQHVEIGSVPVTLHAQLDPPCIWALPDRPSDEIETINSLWFAWYALHERPAAKP